MKYIEYFFNLIAKIKLFKMYFGIKSNFTTKFSIEIQYLLLHIQRTFSQFVSIAIFKAFWLEIYT